MTAVKERFNEFCIDVDIVSNFKKGIDTIGIAEILHVSVGLTSKSKMIVRRFVCMFVHKFLTTLFGFIVIGGFFFYCLPKDEPYHRLFF